jgi:hypothetical protein
MLGREKDRNLLIKLGGPVAAVTRIVGSFSDTERVKRGAMLEVQTSRAERQRWRGVDGAKRSCSGCLVDLLDRSPSLLDWLGWSLPK